MDASPGVEVPFEACLECVHEVRHLAHGNAADCLADVTRRLRFGNNGCITNNGRIVVGVVCPSLLFWFLVLMKPGTGAGTTNIAGRCERQ